MLYKILLNKYRQMRIKNNSYKRGRLNVEVALMNYMTSSFLGE